MIDIKVELCREEAILPKYANTDDAGMDVFAAEDILIHRGKTVIVPLGLKLAIPTGYEIQVRPRSGLSFNTPLRVANSPGTIDSGYRDEVGIIITNTSNSFTDSIPFEDAYSISQKGNLFGDYQIFKGDKIAQIVLQKVPRMNLEIVDSVKDIGTNRGGGFGSTGTK